jgi:hypothetical protein
MLAIEELDRSTCHWPLDEFERGVFLFCGEAVDPSRSPTMRCYCPRHATLAYQSVRAPSHYGERLGASATKT